jgi:uncharacterized protein (TIGR00106 family)
VQLNKLEVEASKARDSNDQDGTLDNYHGNFNLAGGVLFLRLKLATSIKRNTMKVIVDFCIVPIGVGTSVSRYVAACERVLIDAGLDASLHANGTNIEGEWDTIFAAIKRCHEVVHGMGAPRIFTTVKVGTRTDRDQTMEQKVKSVQEKMKR